MQSLLPHIRGTYKIRNECFIWSVGSEKDKKNESRIIVRALLITLGKPFQNRMLRCGHETKDVGLYVLHVREPVFLKKDPKKIFLMEVMSIVNFYFIKMLESKTHLFCLHSPSDYTNIWVSKSNIGFYHFPRGFFFPFIFSFQIHLIEFAS